MKEQLSSHREVSLPMRRKRHVSVFSLHHCPAQTHTRNRRGRSLPPAVGGAVEQPTGGAGGAGAGLGNGLKREERGGEVKRVGR